MSEQDGVMRPYKARTQRYGKAAVLAAAWAICLATSAACASETAKPAAPAAQAIDVAPVWAGHVVHFALLTHGDRQWVAFYDAERRMTIAARRLHETQWKFVRLPLPDDKLAQQAKQPPATTLGWDSHNYVTLALDSEGCLHVSGNMHCVPLLYFRTLRPYDIGSFRWMPKMVGDREQNSTYPRFLTGIHGELLFTYRDGQSGNGDQIFNCYDAKTQTWSRLLKEPLFAGGGKMNAYFAGPLRDRSGVFHLAWVWRDTYDCATNHDVSYARSEDLVHWTTSTGKPLSLPITITAAEVIDPVPAQAGLLNSVRLGFDAQDRCIVTYQKYDADGNTQVYNARREQHGWCIHQTSDWKHRWYIHGGGSIVGELGYGAVVPDAAGNLTQSYWHVKHGSGTWHLDPHTLKPIARPATAAQRSALPRDFHKLESQRPGMRVNVAADLGQATEPGVRYLLRWETMPPNRDRPYPDAPPPSMLRVYRLTTPQD